MSKESKIRTIHNIQVVLIGIIVLVILWVTGGYTILSSAGQLPNIPSVIAVSIFSAGLFLGGISWIFWFETKFWISKK